MSFPIISDPRLYVTTENNALKKGGFDASEPGNPRSGLVEERLSSSRHSAAETLSLVELQEPCPEAAAAAAAQLSLANSQTWINFGEGTRAKPESLP
ncbi:Hypothetical protein SMAX5B_014726 [Scophthalmus maximus]|uniref:Uncharacterized protein n=1 Tax=Scophthalmus maximus TaxID=52904 RepID=A0A2U9C3F0_SCOMX|nr:Hypothetical protein SMAX5B_014726 [Scophthalmus maximus]